MGRPVVVVDVETSALEPNTETMAPIAQRPVGVWGETVEVSWWNLTTGEHATFVPAHNVTFVRSHGDPKALVVNRYLERLVDAAQDDGSAVRALAEQLNGATLAGSNPAFDARFLEHLLARHPQPKPNRRPWHHRLLDVSAYAAGAWGLPGNELPGLADVCRRLGVDPPDHTAAGDVRAVGEALRLLGAAAGPVSSSSEAPDA